MGLRTINPYICICICIYVYIYIFQFGAVCKAVMREGSTIEATLQKLDKTIKVAATDHWRALREREDHQEQEVRRKMAVTEHNRAKITFHHNKIVELTNTIQNSREKIHAALLW